MTRTRSGKIRKRRPCGRRSHQLSWRHHLPALDPHPPRRLGPRHTGGLGTARRAAV